MSVEDAHDYLGVEMPTVARPLGTSNYFGLLENAEPVCAVCGTQMLFHFRLCMASDDEAQA